MLSITNLQDFCKQAESSKRHQIVNALPKGEQITNNAEDGELAEIKRKKATQMIERSQAKPQLDHDCNSKPITLTDECFSSEVAKQRLVVVDFWAPWCGPCRAVGPIIEQLASEYAGKVTFGKINVDENQIIPSQFDVQGIPTLIVFKNGEPIETIVGACPKSHIESKIKPYIDKTEHPK